MPKVIYSMTMSLDGFIAGPGGEIDWSEPDDELHRFHNERVSEVGAQFCGRRLYEVMRFWDTAEVREPSAPEHVREFARIWERLPKIVFSRTLDRVEGNARLAAGDVTDELARVKAEVGGDVAVGGADLASSFIARGLVDEYQVFVSPMILGAGSRFLPPLAERIPLELLETRTFGSRITYLRYGRA